MPLGKSKFLAVGGGGQQAPSAQTLTKIVAALGVSTKGTPNTVIPISNPASIPNLLDTGPLAEEVAFLLAQGAPQVLACPCTPSSIGAYLSAAVTHTGTGLATAVPTVATHKAVFILCSTGGALGTAVFQFSFDGGVTFIINPATGTAFFASVGTPWVVRVPGTFLSLSFAAATYVATKNDTIGIDGTVTPGSGWVGTVTPTAGPIDNYEVVLTVVTGGVLGAAVLGISLDGGNSTEPQMQVPTAGVLVIPGTGLVITCSVGAGNFVQGDTYSFLTAPPGFSTSDITTNMTAIRAQRTYRLAIVHNGAQPNTAAGAISAGSTLETAIEAAFNSDGLDWQGVTEGPSQGGTAPWGGDIVVSGSNAIRDSADTDAVVVAARVGQDWPRTALHTAMHRITSPTTGRKMLRPSGWAYVGRAVAIDPSVDPARRVDGPLPIFQVGRDEDATPGLDDAQINAVQTERDNPGQAVASITSGGFGWKNLTTQANFQWAAGVRVLNMFIAGLRPIAKQYLGSDQVTNLDGTIEEKAARKIDGVVNTAARRRVGLESGGDFPPSNPQASSASASVLRSSQLGQSPHRLDIAYDLQSLGFVSDVQSTVNYSGVLSLS